MDSLQTIDQWMVEAGTRTAVSLVEMDTGVVVKVGRVEVVGKVRVHWAPVAGWPEVRVGHTGRMKQG